MLQLLDTHAELNDDQVHLHLLTSLLVQLVLYSLNSVKILKYYIIMYYYLINKT